MKRTVFIILGIIFGSAILFLFIKLILPGVNVYAENYYINTDQATLVNAINEFKHNNPKFVPPDVTFPFYEHLVDGKSDSLGDYRIYFYYSEENQNVFTWITPQYEESSKVIFVFRGINKGGTLGGGKLINRDFGFFENRKEKRKFEERILNPIKKLLPTENR